MWREVLVSSLLLSAAPVMADVYKCPGPGGKAIYQDAPCNDAAPVVESLPPGSMAVAPLRQAEPKGPPPPPPPVVAVVPEVPRPPTQTPLDTKQFGLLTIGMSEATVKARVGQPDEVTDEGVQLVGGMGLGRVRVKEVHKYTWTYYGDSGTLDSFIHFADGVVISKEKAQR